MHEILLQLVLGVHRRFECGRDSRKKILASKKLCCASRGKWSEEVLLPVSRALSSGALWGGGGGGGLVIRGRRIKAIRCAIEAGKESDEFMKSSSMTMTTVLLRVQKTTLMQTAGCSKQMRILVCILTLMHTPASCLCYLVEMYINHWWCFLHYHLLVSWHVHLF